MTIIYQLVIIALAILLFWKWNCGSKCPEIKETIKRDTTIVNKFDSTGWVRPRLIKETPPEITPRKETIDTVWEDRIITVMESHTDWLELMREYQTRRTYDSTYIVDGGSVQIQEEVSHNKLQRQRIKTQLQERVITNTVTLSQPKRGQLFLGIEGYGGKQDILYGAGASLMYKTRKDRIYEVGPVVFKNQPLMFRAGVKFLLSTRK